MGWMLLSTLAFLKHPDVILWKSSEELGYTQLRQDRPRVSLTDISNKKEQLRGIRCCVTGKVLFNTTKTEEKFETDISHADVKMPLNKESELERQASFQKVFHKKEWGVETGKSIGGLQASGHGSTIPYAQEEMAVLHSVIEDLKYRLKKEKIAILDIPCGDMQWMKRFLETRDDVDYTGMDIVPEIINSHKKTFANTPWQFIHQDIVATPLSKSYDLIHNRQMLQHVISTDALTVLKHFSASGSSYLLSTTFATHPSNVELNNKEKGRFRFLNLELPPFSLTPPLCYSRDGPPRHHQFMHYTALWQLPLRSFRTCAKDTKITKVQLGGEMQDIKTCKIADTL